MSSTATVVASAEEQETNMTSFKCTPGRPLPTKPLHLRRARTHEPSTKYELGYNDERTSANARRPRCVDQEGGRAAAATGELFYHLDRLYRYLLADVRAVPRPTAAWSTDCCLNRSKQAMVDVMSPRNSLPAAAIICCAIRRRTWMHGT